MAWGSMLDFIWIRWMGWTFSIHGVHEGGRCFSRWGRLRACGLCSLSPGATPTAEAERLLERSEMDVRAINIPRSMTSESELQSKEISTQSSLLHTANLNLNTNLHTPPHESKTIRPQHTNISAQVALPKAPYCVNVGLVCVSPSSASSRPLLTTLRQSQPSRPTSYNQPTSLHQSPHREPIPADAILGAGTFQLLIPCAVYAPFSRVNFINDMKHISDWVLMHRSRVQWILKGWVLRLGVFS